MLLSVYLILISVNNSHKRHHDCFRCLLSMCFIHSCLSFSILNLKSQICFLICSWCSIPQFLHKTCLELQHEDYSWTAPRCLLENTSGREMKVNEKTIELLRNIHDPMVVVAIVGLYRTGKSYLMNKLAGKQSGINIKHPFNEY